MRKLTRSGVAVLTLLALVSGCGVSLKVGSLPDDSPTRVLTAGELESSLIPLAEVGQEFRRDDDTADDGDRPLGCITDLGQVTKAADNRAVRKSDAAYRASTDFGFPQVIETIRSYRTVSDASRMMSGLTAALTGCRKVDRTDSDGYRIRLEVSTDEQAIGSGVTKQINIYANGHLSTAKFDIPMRAQYGVLQVGNQVAFLCFVNSAADVSAEAQAVVRLGLDRLMAVLKRRPLPAGRSLDLKATDPETVFHQRTSSA